MLTIQDNLLWIRDLARTYLLQDPGIHLRHTWKAIHRLSNCLQIIHQDRYIHQNRRDNNSKLARASQLYLSIIIKTHRNNMLLLPITHCTQRWTIKQRNLLSLQVHLSIECDSQNIIMKKLSNLNKISIDASSVSEVNHRFTIAWVIWVFLPHTLHSNNLRSKSKQAMTTSSRAMETQQMHT